MLRNFFSTPNLLGRLLVILLFAGGLVFAGVFNGFVVETDAQSCCGDRTDASVLSDSSCCGQHRHQGIHAAGSLRAAIRSTVRSPTAPIRESALMIVQVESSAAIPDVKYGNITLNVDTEQQF